MTVVGAIGNTPILALLPDRSDRYLSTSLFTPIRAKCPP